LKKEVGCWWKFWRRLRALTKQLPLPMALAGGFGVATGGSALNKICFKNNILGTSARAALHLGIKNNNDL
jgi:hypothetical protein